MWRASHKLSVIQNVRPRPALRPSCRRLSIRPPLRNADNPNYPPMPGKSGDQGLLKKFFALVGMGVGGALAYTWYEPEFRTKVEMNVLFAREVLHFIDKFIPPRSQVLGDKELPKIPWLAGPQSNEEKKKTPVDIQAPSKLVVAKPVDTSPSPVAPGKDAEEKAAAAKEKEKQQLKAEMKAEQQRKEKDELAQNQALELILVNVTEDASAVVALAISAMEDAVEVTAKHTQQLKQAMDDALEAGAEEKEWEALTTAHQVKTKALQAVESASQKARQQLEKLKMTVADGKKDAVTKKNKLIAETEKQLSMLNYNLSSAEGQLNKALSEGRIITEFRDLVKKGQQQFKQELESIRPDVQIGGRSGDKMTEDELNSLIAHAHKRISQLQRQLASQQARYQHDLQLALAKQCEEDGQLAAEKVVMEQRRLQEEFQMEKAKWDYQANEQMEKEMRRQLARQAAAHSDHLADVLKVQEGELRKTCMMECDGKVLDERERMRSEIVLWIARMEGIEHALESRADLEKQARKAQELWLACQALMTSLVEGQSGMTDEEKMKPLHNEVTAVAWAGNDHPFVNTITDTLPATALERGVQTEESLVTRFEKVRRMCRRVALIDERGGSLFKYFLSYAQSLFVFTMAKPLTDSDQIDPEDLNTFRLVDNAQYCLARGDLEQALRYMNQLRGMPRAIASDWIAEVRLYLEAKQATNALLAHASASGLGSLF
ncbi:hypothetical protein NP493_896g00056 [Ridgeia piscesae]|uniref:MICOS complex subunit MIC60 n=1 Tax=Ridgeia piscesae TaxID=27915 RepID=A0AAD9KKJ8_RIDPI|nr:hypothetical protein NP493_896g00056 [Ridgeia piscesae]